MQKELFQLVMCEQLSVFKIKGKIVQYNIKVIRTL